MKVDGDDANTTIGDATDPVVTTWLQPVLTDYDASSDVLTITLNGSFAELPQSQIMITAQTFTPGEETPSNTAVLPAASLTLTDTGVVGQYTISGSDLAVALQEVGASGAQALVVSVSDGGMYSNL